MMLRIAPFRVFAQVMETVSGKKVYKLGKYITGLLYDTFRKWRGGGLQYKPQVTIFLHSPYSRD